MITVNNARRLISAGVMCLFSVGCTLVAFNNTPPEGVDCGSRAGVFTAFRNVSDETRTAGVTEAIGDIIVFDRIATISQNADIRVAEGEDPESLPGEAEDPIEPELIIVEADETLYVSTSLNIREDASTDSEIIDTVPITTPVEVTGYVEGQDWAQISYDGQEAYVSTDYLIDSVEHLEYDTYNETWNGQVLAQGIGTVQGPSGKETYYNMNMNGVIRIMQDQLGNYSEYWIRSDGVKMYGDYIMVAANLNVHPRGTLVETSLGTGIVCDTGDFAYGNPTQIDVAVAWGPEY